MCDDLDEGSLREKKTGSHESKSAEARDTSLASPPNRHRDRARSAEDTAEAMKGAAGDISD